MAAKWSIATEIAAKLISPVSNMIFGQIFDTGGVRCCGNCNYGYKFRGYVYRCRIPEIFGSTRVQRQNDQYDSTTVAFLDKISLSLFFYGAC